MSTVQGALLKLVVTVARMERLRPTPTSDEGLGFRVEP